MSERDLIIAMDTERLQEFIDNRKERRNDLWRAASDMEQEAARLKRSGNDMNWEIAIASVELKKRADGQSGQPLKWSAKDRTWTATGYKGHRYEIIREGASRAPYELFASDVWQSDHTSVEDAMAAANEYEKGFVSK